ncbi:MAG: hypothetical protein ACRCX8_05855 [Sarcina sp.]
MLNIDEIEPKVNSPKIEPIPKGIVCLNFIGVLLFLYFILDTIAIDKTVIDDKALGATVGRTSGRIEGGKFSLNGEIYKLFKNYGVNSGHGGEIGFNKRSFDTQTKINS